jgi:ABC-type multidrug transport system fused ATPase/permease subunit
MNLFINSLSEDADKTKILLYVLLFLLFTIVTFSARSAAEAMRSVITGKLQIIQGAELLRLQNDASLEYLDSVEGKDVIHNLSNRADSIWNFPFQSITFLSNMVAFFLSTLILGRYSVVFLLIFLGTSIPGLIFETRANNATINFTTEHLSAMRRSSYYSWILTDRYPARDVRMYDLVTQLSQRYKDEKRGFLAEAYAHKKRILMNEIPGELLKFIGLAAFIVSLWFAAKQNRIGVGQLTMCAGLTTVVFSTWENLWHFIGIDINNQIFQNELINELKDHATDISDNRERKHIEEFESLEFINVSFTYPAASDAVLKNISFRLQRGERLAIVGANGVGKSTLVKLMCGFYKPDSGAILLNGIPMGEYYTDEVRALFSVLFQEFCEYPLTLRENVMLSNTSTAISDERIYYALRAADAEFAYSIALDSVMTREFDDAGIELSRGQWQRIAIARAFYKNSDVYIFDEPSSSLDPIAEEHIFKSFEDISERKTGIMISHRISASRSADCVIVIDGGTVAETGVHADLVSRGGLYSQLYKLQQEKYVDALGDAGGDGRVEI